MLTVGRLVPSDDAPDWFFQRGFEARASERDLGNESDAFAARVAAIAGLLQPYLDGRAIPVDPDAAQVLSRGFGRAI